MKKIIIDTLGADNGSAPIIKGTLRAIKEHEDIGVIFVGNSENIASLCADSGIDEGRIETVHTDAYVLDTDLPTSVFKDADDKSMVMALKRLKSDDEVIGMITAGNTGAALVGSIFHLGLVEGLLAPALATAIPVKRDGYVCLVDCGANTDCNPENLRRFALMGNAFMQAYTGIEAPKVALMSVGRNRHKGNALIKEAYELIEKLPINFIGNIEGCDVVNSEADVIVADGFTGNIILKNTEAAGLAALAIVDELGAGLPCWQEVHDAIYNMFAFNDRGGAVFLGTNKTVVKMHGCANEYTAYACVNLLMKLENGNFSEKVAEALQNN